MIRGKQVGGHWGAVCFQFYSHKSLSFSSFLLSCFFTHSGAKYFFKYKIIHEKGGSLIQGICFVVQWLRDSDLDCVNVRFSDVYWSHFKAIVLNEEAGLLTWWAIPAFPGIRCFWIWPSGWARLCWQAVKDSSWILWPRLFLREGRDHWNQTTLL